MTSHLTVVWFRSMYDKRLSHLSQYGNCSGQALKWLCTTVVTHGSRYALVGKAQCCCRGQLWWGAAHVGVAVASQPVLLRCTRRRHWRLSPSGCPLYVHCVWGTLTDLCCCCTHSWYCLLITSCYCWFFVDKVLCCGAITNVSCTIQPGKCVGGYVRLFVVG